MTTDESRKYGLRDMCLSASRWDLIDRALKIANLEGQKRILDLIGIRDMEIEQNLESLIKQARSETT